MKSRISRSMWLALWALAAGLGSTPSQAGLFDGVSAWQQPNLCSYTTYRFAHRPGSLTAAPMISTTPGACPVAASPMNACGTCTTGYPVQTVQYVPQVAYRTAFAPVPVCACRAVTVADPCTGCPVTTYRPTTVSRPFLPFLNRPRFVGYAVQPACATGCATVGATYAPCASGTCGSGVMAASAAVGADATMAPSLPPGACPSCAPAAQVQVQRYPVIEAAPATSAPAWAAPSEVPQAGMTQSVSPMDERPAAGPAYSTPASGPTTTFAPQTGTPASAGYLPPESSPAYSGPSHETTAPTSGVAPPATGAAVPASGPTLPSAGLPMPLRTGSPVPASSTALPQQPIRPMNGTNWPIPRSQASPQDRLTARPTADPGRMQLISASIPAAPAGVAPPQPTYIDNGAWHTAR